MSSVLFFYLLNVTDAFPYCIKFTHLLASCICLLNYLQTDGTDFHWILTELGVLVFVLFKQIYKQVIFITYFGTHICMESKTCFYCFFIPQKDSLMFSCVC